MPGATRDCALLHPHTGDRPHSHLLDLATVYIPALCHHFLAWATRNPTGWPLQSLKQLAAPP